MTKTFFTSDTHYNQERTFTYSRRPFETLEQSTEAMIANHNAVVGEHDLVYHLGDFGDLNVAKRLNGRTILLLGNYEVRDIQEGKYTLSDLNNIFAEVIVPSPFAETLFLYDKDQYGIKYLSLCHEPHSITNAEDRFYLFGHIHEKQMVKTNALNVGVDCHNFTPIGLKDIEFYINAIRGGIYDEEVFTDYAISKGEI